MHSTWGPLDGAQLRLISRVSVEKRLRTLLESQALVMNIVRGQLRRKYPHLSKRDINLLVIKKLSRNE
jgi:hypothetical protein